MKSFALAASLAAAFFAAQAHALSAGDIAVIAYNADGDDNFAWVALTDIAANTVINFTDASWQDTAFRSTEHLDAGGPLTWTSDVTLAAGTVVSYSGDDLNTWSVGTAGGIGMGLSNSGDQLFVFEGSTASPDFVYGLQFANASGIIAAPTVSSSTNTTNVPDALSLAAGTMVDVGNFDDGYYSGITSGTQAELLAAIADSGNWTRGNDAFATSTWASSFQVTPVPEAETYAMMLAGLGLVGFMAARRRRG
ncbi:MAG: hypothetical protein B7Y26_11215 [Hydrogenophilales bacterium 16-64-46]|nr:MAG: hypothetical protein B7Y26_11215 [Hydrogenophilales bacterium 16-64-46]OZA38410.1 MAG: hypothetical protein B7X87_07930 [Hydrogenophilales bacterium 17-64-34]HQS99768.1 PEP-CTERM sorting domain-containing protein [Thiobacillus sp.]